ncbi:hypothetical protein I0C86_36605 [Plantactinospora sp. S1510]|uniref:Uncharacterized protein n=1 Tax=Plantactinospora alkalitolerans TaxID=2789879 RepID=A0ABS0H7F9_9ACTN|nr:hypothetical protein [Plantactinospora alkalitolerans]MBF9134411.1 hypothetical protein [Plantactinospora alkalitolerans]
MAQTTLEEVRGLDTAEWTTEEFTPEGLQEFLEAGFGSSVADGLQGLSQPFALLPAEIRN